MDNLTEDEIESITYIGEEDTIDINVSGNKLFFANGILTHNSAIEEIEFDHSHISGGLSKIMTADNVIGIFHSRAMRERGNYQIQFMKTRSSSGVGQKVDLEFNIDTLRITDLDIPEDTDNITDKRNSSMMNTFKRTSVISNTSSNEVRSDPSQGSNISKSKLNPDLAAIRKMIKLNPEKD